MSWNQAEGRPITTTLDVLKADKKLYICVEITDERRKDYKPNVVKVVATVVSVIRESRLKEESIAAWFCSAVCGVNSHTV